MDVRFHSLTLWLAGVLPKSDYTIVELSGDASFRRYYRVHCADDSYIVMDAPPDKLSCQPFVTIASFLKKLHIHVPEVWASDLDHGFLLLSDFGDQQYLNALNANNANTLYDDAFHALRLLQIPRNDIELALPDYDLALLTRELEIFREWVLQRYLSLSLNDDEQQGLERIFQRLCDNALEQPQVLVHRDYHSRNLMIIKNNNPGVLDFQDAVIGPVTYDLVSLLRDCYIAWPQQRVERWALQHYAHLQKRQIIDSVDQQTFLRWFDLTGLQRHLKAAGLFVRLKLRDGKAGFWQDIPRTLNYILAVAGRYPELALLHRLIKQQQRKFS